MPTKPQPPKNINKNITTCNAAWYMFHYNVLIFLISHEYKKIWSGQKIIILYIIKVQMKF